MIRVVLLSRLLLLVIVGIGSFSLIQADWKVFFIFGFTYTLKEFVEVWFYHLSRKKIALFHNKKKMLGSLEWHKHSIVNIVSGKHASIVPVRRNTCSLAKPSLNFRMDFTAVWNEKANFNFWKLFSDLSSPLSSNLQNRMVKVNG